MRITNKLSSSAKLSDGTPDDDQVPAAAAPEPIGLQTLHTILQQREDQLVDRILTHLNRPQNPPSPTPGQNLASRNQPQDQPFYLRVGSELGEGPRVPDNRDMFTPLPILYDESASASIDSVEILFPGVERSTLTQIIENRFKPTNIYRLLVSEKDRAESQRVISIGGVSFEQEEREGKESEYRMGPFFKAWAAYCGILTKLAPQALQGDVACSLYIYTMNLHDLLERYAWEGVTAYHFQFHRKRIASGNEVYYPDDWRRIDAELIASKCFLYPSPNINRNWGSERGHSFGRGHQSLASSFTQNQPPAALGTADQTVAPPHPPDIQTSRGPLSQHGPCRNWNYRECRAPYCCFPHSCIGCGGSHRVALCAANTGSRGVVTTR